MVALLDGTVLEEVGSKGNCFALGQALLLLVDGEIWSFVVLIELGVSQWRWRTLVESGIHAIVSATLVWTLVGTIQKSVDLV